MLTAFKKTILQTVFFTFPLLLCSAAGASDTAARTPAVRIVSLSPSTTEILFALGAAEQISGVTTYCEYPPEAKAKPRVGGFTNHNLEAIAALKPDLVVLTPNGGSRSTYQRLKQVKIPVLSLPFYSLEDVSNAFEKLGGVSGHPEKAASLARELLQTVREIKESSPKNRALKAAYLTWRKPLILAGKDTMEEEMIRLAGAENAARDSKVRYPRWSEEAFWASDPDVIFDASVFERMGDPEKELAEARAFWSRFKTLRAVREGHVFLLNREVLPVPGPRTVLQIRTLAAILKDPGRASKYAEGYEKLEF